MRERDAGDPVGTPPARISGEVVTRTDRFARRRKQLLRQLVCVAQAEVETLPGDRMQCLRGVTQEHAPLIDNAACILQPQRKGLPLGDVLEA